jgi:hypothetical protein
MKARPSDRGLKCRAPIRAVVWDVTTTGFGGKYGRFPGARLELRYAGTGYAEVER